MTALVDDLGVWIQLGQVQPNWNWSTFPVSTSTKNSIFRLTTTSTDYNKILTFVYLRVVYQSTTNNLPSGKWQRFYPKKEQEIIDLNSLPILSASSVNRFIQVRKGNKYYGYKRAISDNPYLLNLEEFIPFEEVINNAQNIPQLTEVIDEQLNELKGELTQDIVNQILANISTLNNQGIGGGEYDPTF